VFTVEQKSNRSRGAWNDCKHTVSADNTLNQGVSAIHRVRYTGRTSSGSSRWWKMSRCHTTRWPTYSIAGEHWTLAFLTHWPEHDCPLSFLCPEETARTAISSLRWEQALPFDLSAGAGCRLQGRNHQSCPGIDEPAGRASADSKRSRKRRRSMTSSGGSSSKRRRKPRWSFSPDSRRSSTELYPISPQNTIGHRHAPPSAVTSSSHSTIARRSPISGLLPEARVKLTALSREEIRLALMLDIGSN